MKPTTVPTALALSASLVFGAACASNSPSSNGVATGSGGATSTAGQGGSGGTTTTAGNGGSGGSGGAESTSTASSTTTTSSTSASASNSTGTTASSSTGNNLPCGMDCGAIEAPPCQMSVCDMQTMKCVFQVVGGNCSDGNPCTIQDECVGGSCFGKQNKLCLNDDQCCPAGCTKANDSDC